MKIRVLMMPRIATATAATISAALAIGALGLFLSITSCNVDGYCINCFDAEGTGVLFDAGRDGSSGEGDGGLRDSGVDAPDACVITGAEQCDGIDNDCDGQVDEATDVLAGVGIACGSDVGACVSATSICRDGAIVCGEGNIGPVFERCDGIDNDCDGTIDENNPEGGVVCGNAQGECQTGIQQCIGGTLVCQGEVLGSPEVCNGLDDDCDSLFDEGITLSGSCGPPSDLGICVFGTNTCVGGSAQCVGAVYPKLEQCDNIDHDCDGNPLNGYNLATDPNHCTACGNQCSGGNAFWGCNNGCVIATCQNNYYDLNGLAADGCEYGPCSFQGSEICNGIDDDCDGMIDEGLTANPPLRCDPDGECAGTTAVCDSAAGGYVCNYGPTVSTNASGAIVPETDCDGRDNDCDGSIDEAFPTKGTVCDDGELGTCRDTGLIVCNASLDGVVCTAVDNPADNPPPPETCNNLDDDCDGVIDNGPIQDWVSLGTGAAQIFKYEASRPDSNSTNQGFVGNASVCSSAGRMPWTNITHPQAEAACLRIGARLCTEAEWQLACETDNAPLGNVQQGSNNMFVIEAESGVVANGGWAPTSAVAGFSGTGYMQIPNTTVLDVFDPALLNATTPRIDYTLNFTQTGTHYLWVRMYADGPLIFSNLSSPANGHFQDSAWFAFDDTNGGLLGSRGARPYLHIKTYQSWDWMGQFDNVSGAISFTVPTTGNHTISIYNGEDGLIIDRLVITTDPNFVPINQGPPIACKFSYQTDCKVYQPSTCNAQDFDADPATPGMQNLMLASGSMNACFSEWELGGRSFDLSGNTKEWTSARVPGVNPLRGGSFNNTAAGTSCQFDFLTADDAFFLSNVGFRCCR